MIINHLFDLFKFLSGYPDIFTFLLILVLFICIYLYLYSALRLPKSFFSFIWFFFNFIIIFLYFLGFYTIFLKLENPIYVNNLTVFTIYRYSLFLLLGFFAIIMYFFCIYVLKLDLSIFNSLRFPYLKHEVFNILNKVEFLQTLCENFVAFLHKKVSNVYIYFFINFTFIHLISIIQIIFFINFTFLHGDLRWNIYLLPLSFFSWILKNIEYFFKQKYIEQLNYLREVLFVILKGDVVKPENSLGFIKANEDDLTFTITEFGYSEGFSEGPQGKGLKVLKTMWLCYCNGYSLLTFYDKKFLYYITLIVFLFRVICWVALIYIFMAYDNSLVHVAFYSMFTNVLGKHIVPKNVVRGYAPLAYPIKKEFQRRLQQETQGAYAPGHAGKVDPGVTNKAGDVLFEGTVTHGPGSPDNPSYLESSTHDLRGPNPKGQRTVPPKKDTYIPKKYLGKKIPKSDQFYADALKQRRANANEKGHNNTKLNTTDDDT